MPSALTYPGVYVEEISSGVRTITGVATSITAFIGRAKRGPCDQAVTINSFGDYERIFGGLDLNSTMSYAVRDYYLNGGAQAIIVRLFGTNSDNDNGKTKITFDGLVLEAASPGSWGNDLRVSINLDISEELATQLNIDLFNLTITDGKATEKYLNVTVQGDSERRIDKVLAAQSSLLKANEEDDWPLDVSEIQKKIKGIPEAEEKVQDAEKKVQAVVWKVQDAKKKVAAASNEDEKKNAEDKLTEVQKDLKTAKDDLAKAQEERDKLSTKAAGGNDGQPLTVIEYTGAGEKKGLYALDEVDLFNLLCIPPYTGGPDEAGKPTDIQVSLVAAAAAYCEKRRAMLLVDPPSKWKNKTVAVDQFTDADIDYVGTRSKNTALFFPRLKQPNPLNNNRIEEFVPCGAVAGIMARTDSQRGVWKAPAGIDATLRGVPELSVKLTDAENGELNPLGVNCLRSFPNIGRVIWGARTLRGADMLADEYKYVPVRRLALFIEESLFRGTQWVVFEPNDEPLWAQIRMNVGSFMHTLFRQGAFQGSSPKEAYFVKCDKDTTPQNDIDRGIVNIVVGFAPLKPAEFVVIKLQQIAGDIEF
ncbi:MAG: phage tail sheath family protein [Candidatus Electrothrix sp. AR3]|nr:phage tail sheath family protein [Candidatus Electrothrix sp. AR3]